MTTPPDYQLLLGPAGAGKTHLLRDCFIEALRAGREADALLLVPTASYRDHTRNLILRESGVAGLAGDRVTTFRQLMDRLAPAAPDEELSEPRRVLAVRRLLRQLDLPYLRPVSEFAGFRGELADALDEMRHNRLEPGALEKALGGRAGSERHRCFLTLYREYQAALREAGIDDGQRIARAVRAIGEGRIRCGLLLADGFSDFTPEQRRLLTALLNGIPAARVTLMLDPGRRELFYQAQRSREWLVSLGFREQWLEHNRRAAGNILQAVERAVRGPESGQPESGQERAEEPPPLWAQERALGVIAAADRRDEAELIAREVLRLARSGYRYRDIGIIVRRPGEYAPLLRGAFRRLGIPLRAFFSVPLVETAYGRHLRLCLDLFVPGSRPESLFRWLKSPYSTVHSQYIAEDFEYRATERMADARAGRWEKFVRPDSVTAGVIHQLRGLDTELARAGGARELAAFTARAWDELTGRLEIAGGAPADRVLELRADAAAGRRAREVLAELVEAAEAESASAMSFAEFRELLLSFLAAEQLPPRDRRIDAVNLINPFEARQWELRVVFVAGLVEKEFPAAWSQALFLDDEDRRAIEAEYRVALPTAADRARDERLLFYVAATRARERLYFTRPQTDTAGRPLLPSFFLRGLEPLLNSPACHTLQRRRSEIVCPPETAAGEPDLYALTHAELARFPESNSLPCALAIYEKLRGQGVTRRSALALAPRPGRLRLEAALALLREHALRFNASGLKRFAECAFKYFAEDSLGLKGPAAPKELDYLLQGDIVHSTIEEWERGGRAEPIGEVLERCFERKTEAAGIPASHLSVRRREEMRSVLERFAAAEQRHGELYRTALDPKLTELRFDGRNGVAPLDFTLADGTPIQISGRLDRVEVLSAGGARFGLVVDYKYSKSAFGAGSIEDIREGLELQLPIYMLALRQRFGLEPAGAEICPLKAEEMLRCGVYNSELAPNLFRGQVPRNAVCLAPAGFEELIRDGLGWVGRHATEIRSGRIEVMGTSERNCSRCDFLDLCRMTPWEARERERAAAQ